MNSDEVPSPKVKTLGQIAFEAYIFYHSQTFLLPSTKWEDLNEFVKLAWEYAVEAVLVEKIATRS